MSDANLVRNVYTMLAYAFRGIKANGKAAIEPEPFEHLHDLLAFILAKGVGAQLKRGIHHDYQPRQDELATVRGRIDIGKSISSGAIGRGSLVCEFDEYIPNTLYNQILKSVIVLLTRKGALIPERRKELQKLLPYLESVTLITPESINWSQIRYHRETASYRLLLGVCELIVKGLLHTENNGNQQLDSWLSDDAMSVLYERFIREYYLYHHPELSPQAKEIKWDTGEFGLFPDQLPKMKTDITLTNGNKTLIIDAKFYNHNLQINYGKSTVHSSNLYQLFTYVKNADTHQDGSVAGVLLYAKTDGPEQPELETVIQGNPIQASTLNLRGEWPPIAAKLEEICSTL